jgi:hypothetical protein
LLWWAPALAVAFASLFISERAHAYPWMIRHGYTNCAGCHADPSGGELLTLYGHVISYEVLSTRWSRPESAAASGSDDSESSPSGDGEAGSGDPEASNAALRRRIARAVSHAAGAKFAKPKAKKPDDEEEEADSEDADAEGGEEEDAGGEEDADAGGDSTSEDGESNAEGGGDAEGEGGEAAAASSEPPPAEASPFEGTSGITGPLFGLGPASESLLLGGSVRLASIYKLDKKKDAFRFFPMQLDLYGQLRIGSALRAGASVGVIKVPAGSPHGRAAQITANQDDGYNLISRTHWIGFDFGDGAHTVRVGRLNLPFGIRMAEHVMWVRERTQTDRESDQQHGVALYMGFENVRFELMGILGNYQINGDAFRERGYSGYVEVTPSSNFAVGVSSLYTYAKDDRLEPAGLATMRQAHGPFMRFAPAETVSIMAEADVLLRSRRDMGYVGFLQVDVEPIQGLHFIGTGELLDGGYPERAKLATEARSAGLGRPSPGGWLSLQWFFLPHFDMRVDAIIREEKQILSQLHIYL